MLEPIRERREAALGAARLHPRGAGRGVAQGAGGRPGHDGARPLRGEAEVLMSDIAARSTADSRADSEELRVAARRHQDQAAVVRRAARSARAPDQEEPGQRLRHPDRARHRAVPRVSRPDAGAQPRRRQRVPGDGGDAHPHQEPDAAAASRSGAADDGARGRSARRAGAASARAPEVQGRRRAAARSRNAAQRAVDAARFARRGDRRRRLRAASSKSISSACSPPSGRCSSARASGRRCRCRRSRCRSRPASSSCSSGCRRPKRAGSRICSTTSATRGDMIVTFLALLEMIRLKLIRVFQAGQLGPIRIYKRARPQGCAASDSRSGGRVQGAPPAEEGRRMSDAERVTERETGRRCADRTTRSKAARSPARPDADRGDAGTRRAARAGRAGGAARAGREPRLDHAQLKAIIEALVFASPEPLTPKMLFKLLNDEPKEDVLAALHGAQAGLRPARRSAPRRSRGRLSDHHAARVSRLGAPPVPRADDAEAVGASLETLAVIAYQQPITAAEIGEIRGVNTSGVLSTLMERHLIKIVGRKNVIGRPFLYGTTQGVPHPLRPERSERSAEGRGHGRRARLRSAGDPHRAAGDRRHAAARG